MRLMIRAHAGSDLRGHGEGTIVSRIDAMGGPAVDMVIKISVDEDDGVLGCTVGVNVGPDPPSRPMENDHGVGCRVRTSGLRFSKTARFFARTELRDSSFEVVPDRAPNAPQRWYR